MQNDKSTKKPKVPISGKKSSSTMNSGKSSRHGGVFNYPEPKNLNLEPGSKYKKNKSRAENNEVRSKKNSSTISH